MSGNWNLEPPEPPLIPEALLAFLTQPGGNGHRAPEPVPERIPEGQRNNFLFRYACGLRAKGFTQGEIEAHLRLLNQQRCDPPLPEEEVAEIAKSACRYPPTRPITQAPEPAGQPPAAGPVPLKEVDAGELARAGAPESPESLPLLGREGYIIKGWGHIVAGLPKAGKTELVFACVREWVMAGRKVLWFTEEGEHIWRLRLSRYPSFPPGRFKIVFALGVDVKALLNRAAGGDEDVVVIDTLRGLLQIPDENDNALVTAAMAPWESALKGKTRLYLHHLRKSGGDLGVAVAGAGALVGAVDRVIEIRYDVVRNRRRLTVLSRILSTPDLIYELQEDGELVALGHPAAVALEDVKERALEVLGEEWMTAKEILALLPDPKPSLNQLREALRKAHAAGLVERDPKEERRGVVYRWRRAGLGEELPF